MYYFAYDLTLKRDQMLKVCPESKPKFTATLHHYQLIFTDWTRLWRGATATVKALRGGKMLGGIYEVTEDCLKKLDKYHGTDYHRLNVTVNNEDSEPVESVTYIRNRPGDQAKPSPEYLAIMQQGYKEWRLI